MSNSMAPLVLPSQAPRRRGPKTALRIDTPAQNPLLVAIALPTDSSTTPSLSSATSDISADFPFAAPPAAKPRSLRNMKKLSLSLSSAASSSTNSLALPEPPATAASSTFSHNDTASIAPRSRRPSVASLSTTTTTAALAVRKDEDGGSPTVPYADGPIEIIPGIWLGSEDNARDVQGLSQRGIKAILNVAKEVSVPTEAAGLDYLKMDWSHGQSDLIRDGFPIAMGFVDAARSRDEGVLVHCQCGISRSGTMVIALVMRAAATSSPAVPHDVWALKGMHAAYDYVKRKSRWVGPNMSLIYQLLEYERTLSAGTASPTHSDRSSQIAEDEEEWSRRRQALDDTPSSADERESLAIRREAEALDRAMEDPLLARRASASSLASTSSVPSILNNTMGGLGMGAAWKSKYNRRRAGSRASVSSHLTTTSVISEDLVEEDEEGELLGLGSAYDGRSFDDSDGRSAFAEPSEPSAVEYASPAAMERTESGESAYSSVSDATPRTARPLPFTFTLPPPPSAPAYRTSFSLPPVPQTAVRATFGLSDDEGSGSSSSTAAPRPKGRRRPAPLLHILPPVPHSPDVPLHAKDEPVVAVSAVLPPAPPSTSVEPTRARTRLESKRPTPPPLHLRASAAPLRAHPTVPSTAGATQTLFVFPPSPSTGTRTPATMTLTSHFSGVPFPRLGAARARVASGMHGSRGFIALGGGAPATPTTACSRVDARGWFGADA